VFAQALLLIAAMASTASGDEGNGYVGGIVVNAADGQPVAGAEVVLRRKLDDQFAPVAETTTDAKGKFLFQHLSTAGTIYLPGANWGGVHYPVPGQEYSRRACRASGLISLRWGFSRLRCSRR